jgi:hypothetical protein
MKLKKGDVLLSEEFQLFEKEIVLIVISVSVISSPCDSVYNIECFYPANLMRLIISHREGLILEKRVKILSKKDENY